MNKGNLYQVYCDESRQTKDRYMVFGGIVLNAQHHELIHQEINEWRETSGMFSELKWTKVSKGKLNEYQELVDLLFRFISEGTLSFKSVVFDTWQIDYGKYHNGDKDLGYYKFMYQFLLHSFARKHIACESDRLLIYLDQRTSSYSLNDFKSVLNNGVRKWCRINTDAVRAVEARDSKQADLIQMADIVMGAIGYVMNDSHSIPTASQAKVHLSHYLAEKSGLGSLKEKTPRKRKDFEIWHFQFTGKNKRAPET